jgi:transcriptional regulator of met regulon
MRDLNLVRVDIDRMRVQVGRQRREIAQLRRAGAATVVAEALLHRMLERLDELRKQRERLKREVATLLPRKQRGSRHA